MTAAITPPDPGMVPELLVTDLDTSLDFWCRLCGFAVLYHRINEGFAYIARGSAHIMLEQAGIGRNWITGPLERPLGRGINSGSVPPGLRRQEERPASGIHEAGVTQFLVADPDGY